MIEQRKRTELNEHTNKFNEYFMFNERTNEFNKYL